MKCSWHHGKGSKFTRKCNHEKALKHFKLALKFVIDSDDDLVIALEMECIARALISLGNRDEAIEYAIKSYDIYKKNENVSKMAKQGMIRIKREFRMG